MLQKHFDVEFVTADTRQQANDLIDDQASLILINRIFDFDSDDGIEYIGKIKANFPKLNIMLISNFSDAQSTAVSAGALDGFGKSKMNDPETIARLKKVLG